MLLHLHSCTKVPFGFIRKEVRVTGGPQRVDKVHTYTKEREDTREVIPGPQVRRVVRPGCSEGERRSPRPERGPAGQVASGRQAPWGADGKTELAQHEFTAKTEERLRRRPANNAAGSFMFKLSTL